MPIATHWSSLSAGAGMIKRIHQLEVIVDTCVDSASVVAAVKQFAGFLSAAGYPLQVQLVYTRSLLREQTDLLDPMFLHDESKVPSPAHKSAFVNTLRHMGNTVKILPEDDCSEQLNHAMLKMVKGIARKHPDHSRIKRLVEVLGFDSAAQLQALERPTPTQYQHMFNTVVAGVKLKEHYRDVPETKAYREMRRDNADRSVLEYLKPAAWRPQTEPGQHKVTVFVSVDGRARQEIDALHPSSNREKIVTMDEASARELMQDIMHKFTSKRPTFIPTPFIYTKPPSKLLRSYVDLVTTGEQRAGKSRG